MKNNTNSKLLFELSFIKIISEKNNKIVEKSINISNFNEQNLKNTPKIQNNSQKK